MATTGDSHMATSGDFFMATDTMTAERQAEGRRLGGEVFAGREALGSPDPQASNEKNRTMTAVARWDGSGSPDPHPSHERNRTMAADAEAAPALDG